MVQGRPEVFLRQVDLEETNILAELRAASLLEMGLLRPAAAAEFRLRGRRQFARMLREGRLAAWLLFVDGEPVGSAYAVFFERMPYPETSLHAEIAGVYVAPEFRRRGYASLLVTEALAAARARGVRRIVLQPGHGARGLYERLGFADSGQMRLPVEAPAS